MISPADQLIKSQSERRERGGPVEVAASSWMASPIIHSNSSPGILTARRIGVPVPRRTRRATEFTIKQKARGNKGDKIFPSENIYDEPYFKEQWHSRLHPAGSPSRAFLRGKRHCSRSPNRLFIGIREAEVRKSCGRAGETASSLVICSATFFLQGASGNSRSFEKEMA